MKRKRKGGQKGKEKGLLGTFSILIHDMSYSSSSKEKGFVSSGYMHTHTREVLRVSICKALLISHVPVGTITMHRRERQRQRPILCK